MLQSWYFFCQIWFVRSFCSFFNKNKIQKNLNRSRTLLSWCFFSNFDSKEVNMITQSWELSGLGLWVKTERNPLCKFSTRQKCVPSLKVLQCSKLIFWKKTDPLTPPLYFLSLSHLNILLLHRFPINKTPVFAFLIFSLDNNLTKVKNIFF